MMVCLSYYGRDDRTQGTELNRPKGAWGVKSSQERFGGRGKGGLLRRSWVRRDLPDDVPDADELALLSRDVAPA